MKIKVDNYSMYPSRFIAGTKGSFGFETMDIEFGEDWEGLVKKIVFCPPNNVPVSVVWADQPIAIPYEVMSQRGKTSFAIVGYEGEKTKITVTGELDVLNTLDTSTENQTVTPTADEMAQVLAYMEKTLKVSEEVNAAVEGGEFDGNGWRIGTQLSGEGDGIYAEVEYARKGDLYLNTDTFDVYYATEDNVWTHVGCVKGDVGADAGFGNIEAEIHMIEFDSKPTVSVTATGDDTSKNLSFSFGMPSSYAIADARRPKRYSVRFANGGVVGTREDDAVGMVAEVAVDGETVKNDFDSVSFFNRRICNALWDSVHSRWLVTAYLGDEGFSWEDAEVLYECTPFYISDDTDLNTYVSVCGSPCEGYSLAPMFPNATDKIYLSCFEASAVGNGINSVPHSYAGRIPTSLSFNTAVSAFANFNEKAYFETLEIFYSETVLQLVEFATKDLGSVMRGVCELTDSAVIQSITDEKTFWIGDYSVERLSIGQSIVIRESADSTTTVLKDVYITDVTDNGDGTGIVCISGDTSALSEGNVLFSGKFLTGIAARAVTSASSGSHISNSDGFHPCIWRGKENPWGSGKNLISNCYVSALTDSDGNTNRYAYYIYSIASIRESTAYRSLSMRATKPLPSESGNVSTLGCHTANKLLCLPCGNTVDDVNGQYFEHSDSAGVTVLAVGGGYKSGYATGLSFDTSLAMATVYNDVALRYYMLQG